LEGRAAGRLKSPFHPKIQAANLLIKDTHQTVGVENEKPGYSTHGAHTRCAPERSKLTPGAEANLIERPFFTSSLTRFEDDKIIGAYQKTKLASTRALAQLTFQVSILRHDWCRLPPHSQVFQPARSR
jgi:hypothetical protein